MPLFGAFVLTLTFIFCASVDVRASETSCLTLFDEKAAEEPVGPPADQARADCLNACTNRCQKELERCGQERTQAFIREKCVSESDKCRAYCRNTQCPSR